MLLPWGIQWGLVIYLVTWFGCHMASKLLFAGYKQLKISDIYDTFPKRKRLLRTYPHFTVLALWLAATATIVRGPDMAVHFTGLFLGLNLLAGAVILWTTGIRPNAMVMDADARFIIEETHTWRSKAQLAVAVVYLAVPVVFLFKTLR